MQPGSGISLLGLAVLSAALVALLWILVTKKVSIRQVWRAQAHGSRDGHLCP